MSDRELLELAAKAAGMEMEPYQEGRKPHILVEHESGEGLVPFLWNPLTNDGDALRLAVKLRLDVSIMQACVVVAWFDLEASERHQVDQSYGFEDEAELATRRAIVRAAAEIGRNMK